MLVLQVLHQLHFPSLDILQHLNVFFVVRDTEPKCSLTIPKHRQMIIAVVLLATLFLIQTRIPLASMATWEETWFMNAVDQHPQILFCWSTFQALFSQPIEMHGIVVTQVQDSTLGFVEPLIVCLGPSRQLVQIPPTFQQISTPTQLGYLYKLTKLALHPLIQIIDKDIKQD
ncbi:hypothetical protein BTVI_96985 [Pitangus sulphuratus]|nr:hypothetical protein BTVI_96985 [Pitangus sulphuratus]